MPLGIWNQIDEVALYLGLTRLDGESDSDFYNRIRKFSKWKYKTDYNTLVHSIPLQTGLETYKIATITSEHPFKCVVEWEYFTVETFPTDGSAGEFARVFINSNDTVIKKIKDTIDKFQYIHMTLENQDNVNIHQRFIVRGSNTKIVTDFTDNRSYKLEYKNIVRGSFSASNRFLCRKEVESLQDLNQAGDYFVDYDNGYLQTYSDISDGVYISYKYYSPSFDMEGTELNLIPMNIFGKYGASDDIANAMPYLLNNKVWGK